MKSLGTQQQMALPGAEGGSSAGIPVDHGGGKHWVEAVGEGEGVEGGLLTEIDREAIRKEIYRHFGEFRDCYERSLLDNPDLSGAAHLTFDVASEGRPSKTKVELQLGAHGTAFASSQTLSQCLSEVGHHLQFPKNSAGHFIRYRLLLKS